MFAFLDSKMVRDSLGTILLSFLPIFVIISCAILSSLEDRDCNILTVDGSGFWRPWYWKSPSASLISSYIKGMSTSVRFRSIIVDCGLGCPTRVSGDFLQSWARADSVVFVHHDSALSIASLRDCGILPVRWFACFISCYFVCFDALPFLILFLHAFVYRGRTVHAVLWCRHVFARSCVHMFFMRCVYIRSTCQFRLHRALVHSPPFIYCVRVACFRCMWGFFIVAM